MLNGPLQRRQDDPLPAVVLGQWVNSQNVIFALEFIRIRLIFTILLPFLF